jgi:hypothetical protein
MCGCSHISVFKQTNKTAFEYVDSSRDIPELEVMLTQMVLHFTDLAY